MVLDLNIMLLFYFIFSVFSFNSPFDILSKNETFALILLAGLR